MQLEIPTRELIEKYRKEFENKNNADEEAIKELFKIFPDNKDYKGVLLKSIVINSLYYTQIRAITNVAKHIVELNIDARLRQGDPEVVEQIASLTFKVKGRTKGKMRRNYSFATKYCSFHQPDLYPIYDSIVDKILKAYQRQDTFSSQPLGDLKDYHRFKEVLEKFVTYYEGLGMPSWRELDYFLHDYGREKFPIGPNKILSKTTVSVACFAGVPEVTSSSHVGSLRRA